MKQRPLKVVIGQRSRIDETYAEEGDVPYYARWDDGSEYQAEPVPGVVGGRRSFHGPKFGLALGEWKSEVF